MSDPSLLVVEDDEGLCSQYRWAFPGYEVAVAQDRAAALEQLADLRPPVVVMDLGLPPDIDGVSEGFALLEEIRQSLPQTKAIVVTGNGEHDVALRAVSLGAYDFCEKPVSLDVLRTIVDRARNLHRLEEENERLLAERAPSQPNGLITTSERMLKICRDIEKLAATNVTVMLLGESGTGKEVLARSLHAMGGRARAPFVAINCGAIPEHLLESELFGHERGAFTGAQTTRRGRFEQADGGTLFLDEIGDMPFDLQTRLLRVLSDGQFYRVGGHSPLKSNVRVIAATHQNLEERVRQGVFREDLFHRLNVIRLRLPALRERREDIPMLTRLFLGKSARELGVDAKRITDEALARLSAFDFPGNVRQLENLCHWLTVLAPAQVVKVEDLPLEMRQDTMSAPLTRSEISAAVAAAVQAPAGVSAGGDWTSSLVAEVERRLQAGVPDVMDTLARDFEAAVIRTALRHTHARRIHDALRFGVDRQAIARKLQELQLEE